MYLADRRRIERCRRALTSGRPAANAAASSAETQPQARVSDSAIAPQPNILRGASTEVNVNIEECRQ